MIRRATPEDRPALREMSAALSRRGPVPDDVFDEQLGRAFADERTILLVASDGERVAGYLLGVVAPMFVYGGLGFVQELYVQAERRREGIGAELMGAFEAVAGAAGARVVALATSRAGAFYQALGFEGGAEYYHRDIAPQP